ncbi:MAG: hypothetical protein LBU27_09200 [Candidatus Peribacteria bacterium]|nr:hypothetical protein [Candidatus Peribacteria bacterium]
MGFVDVIRKSINQLFKRKKDNAFGDDAAHSALSLFSGAYRKVGNNHLHSFL